MKRTFTIQKLPSIIERRFFSPSKAFKKGRSIMAKLTLENAIQTCKITWRDGLSIIKALFFLRMAISKNDFNVLKFHPSLTPFLRTHAKSTYGIYFYM